MLPELMDNDGQSVSDDPSLKIFDYVLLIDNDE